MACIANVMKKNTCAFCIKLPYLCVCDCFLEQQWKVNLTSGSITLLYFPGSGTLTFSNFPSDKKNKKLILDSHTEILNIPSTHSLPVNYFLVMLPAGLRNIG